MLTPKRPRRTALAEPTDYRGNAGDEVLDEDFNFHNARRRSNSSSLSSNIENFKTKFEVNEPEPVFEETMGAEEEENKTVSPSSASSVDDNKSH
ncbi:hypothetical protein VTH82DRAFT_5830 [Thermothelomyces myriococcoides]